VVFPDASSSRYIEDYQLERLKQSQTSRNRSPALTNSINQTMTSRTTLEKKKAQKIENFFKNRK